MKYNNLYRVITDKKTLKSIKEVEFSSIGFKERYDIQEWIESNPQTLGEELLIISKDLSFFNETKGRPDLIALDKKGNVVIIELKRDDSGLYMEWQAIKYASYLSKFKQKDIVSLYSKYLTHYFPEEDYTDQTVEQKILDFIDEETIEEININQRLILVSHRFAREVTSAVNWLIDKYSMDIKCVQIIPFHDIDRDAFYIQTNTILPVPGVEELLIGAAIKQDSSSSNVGPVKKDDETTRFCEGIYNALKDKLGSQLPDKKSRWAGVDSKFRYFHLWYSSEYWNNWSMSYRLWIYNNAVTVNEKVRIAFEINERDLLTNGFDESSLEKLNNFLKGKANQLDFQYSEKNVTKGIFTNCGLDHNKIVEKLFELINSTNKEVIQIINKNEDAP